MKTLRITKRDYDDLVYPAVAANTAKDIQELRIASKVLDKLEQHGRPAKMEAGRPAAYRAESPALELELEDREAELVAVRLVQLAGRLQDWQAREVLPLVDMLRKEEFDELGIRKEAST